MSTEPPATTSDTSEASGSDSSSTVADLPDGGLTFMRTGGIAGVEDELVVQPDGSFTVQRGEGSRNGTLDPDELADLAAAVDELDWAALEAAASGAAADDDYAFTVSAGDRSVAIPGSQLPRPVPELFVVAQELLEQD